MRKILPYLLPLFILAGTYLTTARPQWFLYIIGVVVFLVILFFRIIMRKSFAKEWNVWLNYCLFLLSGFLQLSIIESQALQAVYTIVFTGIWTWLVYSVVQYFYTQYKLTSKQYLEVNRFIYFATLWQAANFLYFGLLFVNIRLVLATVIFALLVYLLGRHIIRIEGLKKSSSFLVSTALVLTSTELFVVLSLLPIHFYIQSAIATLWFFFIIELTLQGQELTSRKKLFWRYSILFIVVSALLILTSYTS